jgi:ATP-dependent protease HslVU (ClpYQ) peptidase subunit
MTCIVGIVKNGNVYIGGDSAGVDGRYSLVVRADRKVFRNDPFVMGFTSSFRMGQLLAFGFSPPAPRSGVDVMEYMVTDFIDAVRSRMKAGGYARTKDSVEEGGTFLVGYKGRLFHIQDDFQVGESTQGFDACGCGDQLALGSLRSTREWNDSRARVTEALATAEAFSAGVRGPFFIEEMVAKP